jgi:hypothetical protein
MFFDEQQLITLLRNLVLPNESTPIRLSPSEQLQFDDGRKVEYPAMYFGPGTTYYNSTESYRMLVLNFAPGFDYMCCWWYNKNRFSLSIIEDDGDEDDETKNIKDYCRIGYFNETEEEHFQKDCLKGAPIPWELEVLIKDTMTAIQSFYETVVSDWENVK